MPEDYFDERIAAASMNGMRTWPLQRWSIPWSAFSLSLQAQGARLSSASALGASRYRWQAGAFRFRESTYQRRWWLGGREKPEAAEIGVTIGDFATVTVDAPFSLVYLVANTIMNLTTQDEQVAAWTPPLT